jgi:spore maturation protein CgeB
MKNPRVLLYDTTAYFPSSPTLLEGMLDLDLRVEFFDEAKYLRPRLISISRRLFSYSRFLFNQLNRDFVRRAAETKPDLIVVVKGSYLRASAIREAKRQSGACLVNFATDDPFNRAVSTPDLLDAVKEYDLYLSTKRNVLSDLVRIGAKRAAFIHFGYKPTVHFPQAPTTEQQQKRFGAEVAFIGGADRDRIPYFERLVHEKPRGVALYGGYWGTVRTLRRFSRGIVQGQDYRMAQSGARIVVALVRAANRDGHAMRTFEIPACGAFMLAERTDEHADLFIEGKEAAFFNGVEEFIDKIDYYLNHEDERLRIAKSGHERIVKGNHRYADRVSELLSML